MKTIYITKEQAIDTHRKTILYSGGGDCNIINEGYLCSALELIQNDDFYPTFEDKLVHLVWSINRNHSFSDGNKRLSITLGVQFLSMNGYLFCISRFLQEMENLRGILIATTNLTENLDKAFERRFLYKVHFENPSVEAKTKIWSSLIPELAEGEPERLAGKYAFSGGQIENISRKRIVQSVLTGHDPTIEEIEQMCREEQIGNSGEKRRIGF